MLQAALGGGASFREVSEILAGLSYQTATQKVPPLPHSIFELLWHVEFVQKQLLGDATGADVDWEAQATWWPGEASEAEWDRALRDLSVNLAHAQLLAEDPSARARDALTDLATHDAYHWGQVVTLRQLLGDWPPA